MFMVISIQKNCIAPGPLGDSMSSYLPEKHEELARVRSPPLITMPATLNQSLKREFVGILCFLSCVGLVSVRHCPCHFELLMHLILTDNLVNATIGSIS